MRACLLAYTFYESDFRVLRYAEALARRGYQVDVIALRSPTRGFHEVINGVHVYHVQRRLRNEKGKFSYFFRIMKFLFVSGFLLSRLHMKHRYDLVHVHSVPDFLVFAAVVPKILGAKVILDIHDILPEFYASKFGQGEKGLLFELLVLIERTSSWFADHIIIANHIWEKKLIARSVKATKLTTLINYPDTSIFFPRKRTREVKEFQMLYPGTINWHQGLDIAVRALALIRDKAPHASLHIYGDGTHRSYIEELIRHLGLSDRAFLKTAMPLRDLAEVIAQADLGIIPKRNDQFGGEAFSTKSLEFMASGIPIIISKTKIDQYYYNDSLVKFFEPENVEDLADAMLTMVRDKSLRDRLSKSGLEFAKSNAWGDKKEEYLKLVNTLSQQANR